MLGLGARRPLVVILASAFQVVPIEQRATLGQRLDVMHLVGGAKLVLAQASLATLRLFDP
jgi:hypothetical protein